MDKEIENTQVGNNSKSKTNIDDKWFTLILGILFIIVIICLFQHFSVKKTEETLFKPLNPSPPGIRIERYDSRILSNLVTEDVVTEITEFSNSLLEQGLRHCTIGLDKAIKLYNSGFHEDAFFKFGVVSENILFAYYRNSDGEPKVSDSIKKAFEQKIISKKEKDYLFNAKNIRNMLAHNPEIEIAKEKIDRYLKNNISILKKITNACEVKLLVA